MIQDIRMMISFMDLSWDSDFSKWIEAVAYSLTQHPDPELEKIADGAIDIV